MEKKNTETGFTYIYSAKEQDEIKKIRQKYLSDEEDGINRLRKMDAGVSKKAAKIALIIGIVGALVMGSGMSLIMTDFGTVLGLTGARATVIGTVVGLLGIVLSALAFPVYGRVLKKERKRIAPEVLRLTEDLMK